MALTPRDYQIASDQALWSFLHDPSKYGRNPLCVLATGLGKSLCMAMFKWRMLSSYPSLKILNVTHVKELVEGNYKALLSVWPAAPAGIYSAGLGRKDARNQITFCGVQSVANRAATFGKVDFVVIDEAHRISPNSEAQYGKFIKALKERNPNLIVIGFTATDYRMGSGRLTDEGGLFDEVVFNLGEGESFVWAIEQGYLIKPIPYNPGFQVDESKVRIQGGEYKNSDAQAAFHDQNILERAVDTLIAVANEENRQAMLAFCQSVEDSELVADMFRYKGRHVEAVHSKMTGRDEILEAFKAGKLWGVTNRDVLTTGFDNPRIDLMGILRLTRSPGLWVQILGRGTRPSWVGHIGHNGGPPMYDISTVEGRLASIRASHKQNCRVLDFAGNTERLGPINYPVVPERRGKKGGGDPPYKQCPICRAYHHTSAKVCDAPAPMGGECGHVFPPPKRFTDGASKQDLVLSIDLNSLPEPEPRKEEILSVHEMICTLHTGKKDKPDTMRVDYRCGFNRYSTWVCFGHPDKSFPRRTAETWWRRHGGEGTAPKTIEEAVELSSGLNKPKFIKVWTNTKYPEIVGYDFVGNAFEINLTGEDVIRDPEPDPLVRSYDTSAGAYLHDGYYDDDIPF